MRLNVSLGENRSMSARWWPERLAAVLALAGVVLASLPGYHVRTWQDAGSDFKTLYASARCFVAGTRAYSFLNIGNVFKANGVVLPASWYAHAPTYPPFTFALLAPITAFPMVQAVYLWMGLSALALVFAIWSMADTCEHTFTLRRAWRLLLIPLVVASPLVSFGLQIGNVSVMAAALCILAVMTTGHASWRAAALTLSLLLKPHIALWLLVGMFVSRNRDDRALVVRTFAFFAVALVCIGVWFSIHLPFGLQLRDYTGMVTSEISTGCLNPRNHELLPPVAEITSLESFFGFFLDKPWMQIVNGLFLLLMGGALAILSRSPENNRIDTRLELLGAWSTFGLLVTYHRTHDGIILFLLLPWVLMRLQRRGADALAWGVLFLGVAMSFGGFPPPGFSWIWLMGAHWLAQFMLYRQSAISMLLLMLVLLGHLWRQARSGALRSATPERSVDAVPTDDLTAIAHRSRRPLGSASGFKSPSQCRS